MPWCLRDNVVRSTPCFFATARYEKDAPGSHDSISSIAFSIGFMVVELWLVEVGMIWMHLWWGGSERDVARNAHGHVIEMALDEKVRGLNLKLLDSVAERSEYEVRVVRILSRY